MHCVGPGGALDVKRNVWTSTRRRFLFPVRALSKVFRGKMLEELRKRGLPGISDEELRTRIAASAGVDWVVYAKPPFGGPRQVLRYLARYTHKVAIGDHRLVDVDAASVAFTYKDYADGNAKKGNAPRNPRILRPLPAARLTAPLHEDAQLRFPRKHQEARATRGHPNRSPRNATIAATAATAMWLPDVRRRPAHRARSPRSLHPATHGQLMTAAALHNSFLPRPCMGRGRVSSSPSIGPRRRPAARHR